MAVHVVEAAGGYFLVEKSLDGGVFEQYVIHHAQERRPFLHLFDVFCLERCVAEHNRRRQRLVTCYYPDTIFGIFLVGEADVASRTAFHAYLDAAGSEHSACFGCEQHTSLVAVGIVRHDADAYCRTFIFKNLDHFSGLGIHIFHFIFHKHILVSEFIH